MSYFLNCHIIRPSALANMNRGDDGSQKRYHTASGAMRAYISSQCLNYCYRKAWAEDGDFSNSSIRTKAVRHQLIQAILAVDPSFTEEEADLAAGKILDLLGIKPDGKNSEKSQNAVFMSRDQYKAIAEIVKNHKDELLKVEKTEPDDDAKKEQEPADADKKAKDKAKKKKAKEDLSAIMDELKTAVTENVGPEIYLKGSFVPSNALLTVQACWQTAAMTAINDYVPTMDFYSSTDDVLDENSYLDVQESSQNLFYEYNVLNLSRLAENVGAEMAAYIAARAMEKVITVLPDSMQNRFASYDMPVTALFTIRERQANLQSAFWAPSHSDDIIAESVKRLGDEAQRMYDSFLEPPTKAYVIGKDVDLGDVKPETGRMKDVLADMQKDITGLLSK